MTAFRTAGLPRALLGAAVAVAGLGMAAAGLGMATGAAQAADLPAKAVGVNYVRQCTAEGAGFYYVPGTDTCLRVGGYLYAEGYYNTYSNYPLQNNKTYSVSTGGLILDARTATDYGTLRSYIEMRLRWRSSDPWSDGPNQAEADFYKGFIQFAGFTFGHAESFFSYYANANVLGTDPATIGDDTKINLIAYTAEFANGFSATLSLEDANQRTSGVNSFDPALPDTLGDYQAGVQVPEFVANIRNDGKWGTFQLSGALHQVRSLDLNDQFAATDTWGYALQAGIMFNLPMVAEGDTLYLQTAYANGATSYLGLQNPSGDFAAPDAYLTGSGLSLVSGWNVTGQYLHNWSEKWNSAVFAGYAEWEINNAVAQAAYGATGGRNANVGANLVWTPVANLIIGVQYDFTRYSASNYVQTDYGLPIQTVNAHRGLLYLERDF
ncbi:porin [Azorhizobium doebereinerae]|uniref:porin n=1 Tax=Azorhizobium doebereinerae TaxID=281091 RepID=UPI0003FCF589|nr:porin [Azorhizobium doebereinerae]